MDRPNFFVKILTEANKVVEGSHSPRQAARALHELGACQEDIHRAKVTLTDDERQAALVLIAAQKEPRTRARIVQFLELPSNQNMPRA